MYLFKFAMLIYFLKKLLVKLEVFHIGQSQNEVYFQSISNAGSLTGITFQTFRLKTWCTIFVVACEDFTPAIKLVPCVVHSNIVVLTWGSQEGPWGHHTRTPLKQLDRRIKL